MSTKHTSGPWRTASLAGRYDRRVNAYAIKYGPSGNHIAIVEANGNAALDNEANGRLIAAAPELLAALIRWEQYARDNLYDDANCTFLASTRAVIAKATKP